MKTVPCVMFHHFKGRKHHNIQGALDQDGFERLIFRLKPHGLLSAEDWFDKYERKKLSEKDFCFTFDDNLKSQFDIALPVLEAHKLTAFWFVYSDPLSDQKSKLELYRFFRNLHFSDIEAFYTAFFNNLENSSDLRAKCSSLSDCEIRSYLGFFKGYSFNDRKFRLVRDKILTEQEYFQLMDSMIAKTNLSIPKFFDDTFMSGQEIQILNRKGHLIGLHSHSHPTKISSYTKVEIASEYIRNKKVLEKLIENKIVVMSHPNGDFSETTLAVLEDLNIVLGFGSNVNSQLASHPHLTLPRVDHNAIDTIYA